MAKTLIGLFILYIMVFYTCGCKKPYNNKIDTERDLKFKNWGYSYNDLINDLNIWKENPYINIDTIGTSVQGRYLWELKITDKDIPAKEKKTIYIHARTHPCEIQSFIIAKNIINFLSSNRNLAELIRRKCIFYILPMYNPDGVELNYSRENANTFDLESNWCSAYLQPEVIALRNRFENLMLSDSPIAIALNLHSSMKCKRYFVFHNSTNERYVEKQKDFIKYVRSYFSDGIEPWWFEVKWQDGIVYSSPESWWWDYYGSKVLALTFEDKNCTEASQYDKTAQALLLGIYNFIEDINDM